MTKATKKNGQNLPKISVHLTLAFNGGLRLEALTVLTATRGIPEKLGPVTDVGPWYYGTQNCYTGKLQPYRCFHRLLTGQFLSP